MSDLTAPTQPPAALRAALVAGIRRRRSRIRFRASVAVAASVAVVAALFGGGVFTGGPERVLAIDDSGEWVTIQILDGDAGAAEMTQELQDAGIDAEVQALPTTPDEVGRWMGFDAGKEVPRRPCDMPEDADLNLDCVNPPLVAGDDIQFGDDVLRIRRDAVYKLGVTTSTFYVGREPGPGESPVGPPAGTDLQFVYPEVDNGSEGPPIEP